MGVAQAQELPVNIVGSSVFGRYPEISPEKTYNMFISGGSLVNYSGYKKVLDLNPTEGGVGEGRGFFKSIRGNITIAVINSSIYRINSMNGATFVGTISSSSGPVFMDENLNSQICIVDGLNAYIYNRDNNALTIQSLGGSLIPNYVCYHNTYFLMGNADISGNGAEWFALSYATDNTISITYTLALQTKPDFAKAVVRIPGKGNNVAVMGTSVTEIQTDIGGLLGYRRVSTMNIDYGVLSVGTIAKSDTMIAWLAVNESNAPVIMVFDGSQANTISTDGINYILGSMKHPEKSSAFFYKADGHLFYQITFYHPDDNLTLFHDFNSKKTFHASNHCLDFHPARQVVYINENLYFISLTNGSIYQTGTNFVTYDENIGNSLSSGYVEEDNRIIPRQRIAKNMLYSGADRFVSKRFTFYIEQGQDENNQELTSLNACDDFIVTQEEEEIVTQQGENIVTQESSNCLYYRPRVDFSYSVDGGETYSNEVGRELNFTAHRRNVLSWNRLGSMNEFTTKVKFWGASRFVANDGVLEVTK